MATALRGAGKAGDANRGMHTTINLGRMRGITIQVHPSWLLAPGLITIALARVYLPSAYPDWTPPQYWLAGLAGSLLLFVSLLLHELGHAAVALARGLHVRSITLFVFGGATSLRGETSGPRDDLLVAAVGPLTSFAVAGLFWLLGEPAASLLPEQAVALLECLVVINVLLGLFNVLPAPPLDGGRAFRVLVWGATGSEWQAAVLVAAVGRLVALAFITVGVWQLLSGHVLAGLWLAVIGSSLTK